MTRFLELFMQYGLVAAILVWAGAVGLMAYHLTDSPWRWAFIALSLGGFGDGRRHSLDPEICQCVEQGATAGIEIVKAKIHVTLKHGILDPQGKAIEHALDSWDSRMPGMCGSANTWNSTSMKRIKPRRTNW